MSLDNPDTFTKLLLAFAKLTRPAAAAAAVVVGFMVNGHNCYQ